MTLEHANVLKKFEKIKWEIHTHTRLQTTSTTTLYNTKPTKATKPNQGIPVNFREKSFVSFPTFVVCAIKQIKYVFLLGENINLTICN